MTIDRSPEPGTPRRRRSPGPLGATCAVAVFLALLALLAARMRMGEDPALRARAAATPPPVRRVLVRRVIERTVIVHLPPSSPARASSSSQLQSAGVGSFPTPITRPS